MASGYWMGWHRGIHTQNFSFPLSGQDLVTWLYLSRESLGVSSLVRQPWTQLRTGENERQAWCHWKDWQDTGPPRGSAVVATTSNSELPASALSFQIYVYTWASFWSFHGVHQSVCLIKFNFCVIIMFYHLVEQIFPVFSSFAELPWYSHVFSFSAIS